MDNPFFWITLASVIYLIYEVLKVLHIFLVQQYMDDGNHE